MTIAEQLKREGLLEGEARGQARILLRQLSLRFGQVPTDVEARISSASVDDFERWAERVLTATSMNEVFRD